MRARERESERERERERERGVPREMRRRTREDMTGGSVSRPLTAQWSMVSLLEFTVCIERGSRRRRYSATW